MKFKSYTKFGEDAVIQKAAEDDPIFLGYISGWAATNEKDRYGDVITEIALQKGARQLLKVGTVFADHNYSIREAIARVTESSFKRTQNKSGIWVKVGITKTEPELWVKMQEGIIDSFSIGGVFNEVEYDEDLKVSKVKDLDLWELSIVGVPANPTATVESLDNLAMKFIKSLNQKKASEELKKEEKKMTNEDNKEVPEWKNELLKLEKQIASLKDLQESKTDDKDKAIIQLTDSVSVLAKTVQPLLEAEKRKKDLAERQSVLEKEAKDKFESMTDKQKETYEMRRIIETLQDPTVDEVLILGNLEYIPPIHERSIEDILEEKRRAGA